MHIHRTCLLGCLLTTLGLPSAHAAPTLTNLTENLPQTAGGADVMRCG